jgi:hypothetical protein
VEQLACGGVLEAVRVARAGYPVRIPLDAFVNRYRLLERSHGMEEGNGGGVRGGGVRGRGGGDGDELRQRSIALLTAVRHTLDGDGDDDLDTSTVIENADGSTTTTTTTLASSDVAQLAFETTTTTYKELAFDFEAMCIRVGVQVGSAPI